jgi:probable HAF family extracellular repeat protein
VAATTGTRRGAALAAVVLGLGLFGAGVAPAPAGAFEDDTADDIADWTNALQGFVLRGGSYDEFEVRERDATIYPSGINDSGEVTGEYVRKDGESAFVRSADGRLTTFDVRGARATEASKINDAGQVVGRYSEDSALVDDSSRVRGFVRDRAGEITRIDHPDAKHTLPTGINDGGEVVGYYVDARDEIHGFLWRDDRFTNLDLVGATSPTPMDINDNGEVVGMYVDADGAARAFLLAGEGYTTLSAPGGRTTMPAGINDQGQIVGYTADDRMLAGAAGFVRAPSPADGAAAEYTPVAVPGAPRTVPLGINDKGEVVGLDETPDPAAPWPNAAEEWTAMSAAGSDRLQLVTVRDIEVNAAIAPQLEQMLAAAEADGITFTGGGYRSPERQVELRRQNCGSSYYAVYEAPSSQCSPPTARPGRSLHERGLAIDFSCRGHLIESHDDPCFAWLDANAGLYGFINLPSEAWHWSITGQ